MTPKILGDYELLREIGHGGMGVVLDTQGNVWITDFGLAQVQGDAAITATGEAIGTLRYMVHSKSPDPFELTQRSIYPSEYRRIDCYSFGGLRGGVEFGANPLESRHASRQHGLLEC